MQIRIKSTPPGEAPEEVRRAWIGVVIPVPAHFASRRKGVGFGVLTGPKNQWLALLAALFGFGTRQDGYAVESSVAIDLLAAQAPEAAQWWRKHTPHLAKPGRYFMFASEACEEIP